MHSSTNAALVAFVRQYTTRQLVSDMNGLGYPITRFAVYHWLSGRWMPRPEHAVAIVSLSKGSLSLRDIYPGRGNEPHGSRR